MALLMPATGAACRSRTGRRGSLTPEPLPRKLVGAPLIPLVYRSAIVVSCSPFQKPHDCPPTGARIPLRRSPPVKEATDRATRPWCTRMVSNHLAPGYEPDALPLSYWCIRAALTSNSHIVRSAAAERMTEGVQASVGAIDGIRTRIASLEGWCSAVELLPQGPAHCRSCIHATANRISTIRVTMMGTSVKTISLAPPPASCPHGTSCSPCPCSAAVRKGSMASPCPSAFAWGHSTRSAHTRVLRVLPV